MGGRGGGRAAWGSSSPALTRRGTSAASSQASSDSVTSPIVVHAMPIRWTDNPEADALLEREPLALLIGLVLDQQVKMEKAFSGPYELQKRIGHLDARKIASMDPAELDRVFRERPALHRFPGSMAKRVQEMCAALSSRFGGDAGSVWRDARTGRGVAGNIPSPPGLGELEG